MTSISSDDLLGWVTSFQTQSITGGFILNHVFYNTVDINNKLGVYWDQISVKWFSSFEDTCSVIYIGNLFHIKLHICFKRLFNQ